MSTDATKATFAASVHAADESHTQAWELPTAGVAPTTESVRRQLAPGRYLVWEDAGLVHVHELAGELTRIGRSLSADVRFEAPTVSRRHALVLCDRDGGVRALDDRSLNGLYVNGRRTDSAWLSDGDELTVGSYTLRFLDVSGRS